jgi:alcohol dehydrogenase
VVSIPEKNYKPAIAYDLIYPRFAIDDPALMTGLSEAQTRFVSIDAMNHVIEAATSCSANPLSIQLAAETIRLVTEYLPVAEKDPRDLKARYFLAWTRVQSPPAPQIKMHHVVMHFLFAELTILYINVLRTAPRRTLASHL